MASSKSKSKSESESEENNVAGQLETKSRVKTPLMSVEFIRSWSRYCSGDVAGFDPGRAGTLVYVLKVAVMRDTATNQQE